MHARFRASYRLHVRACSLPRPRSLRPLPIIPTVRRRYEPRKWVSVSVRVSLAHIHRRASERMQTYHARTYVKAKVGGRGRAKAGEAA